MSETKELINMLQPNITFVMIKQDAIRNKVADDIIAMIESHGFNTVVHYQENISEISEEQINEFYKDHIGKPYFPDLFKSISLGARPLIVEYPFYDVHAWQKMRELIGATNSRTAADHTIRGKFGGHKYNPDAPLSENAIHASDSLKSVLREIKIIFPDVKGFFRSANHGEFYIKHIDFK